MGQSIRGTLRAHHFILAAGIRLLGLAAAANKHLRAVAAEVTAILNDPARYRAT